jgi:hypothetical protein
MSELDLDYRPEVTRFFSNLKAALPGLEALLEECTSHCVYRTASIDSIIEASMCICCRRALFESLRNFERLLLIDLTNDSLKSSRTALGRRSRWNIMKSGSAYAADPRSVFPFQIFSGNGCEIWPQSATSSAIDAKRLGFVALFVQSEMKFVSASRRNQVAAATAAAYGTPRQRRRLQLRLRVDFRALLQNSFFFSCIPDSITSAAVKPRSAA